MYVSRAEMSGLNICSIFFWKPIDKTERLFYTIDTANNCSRNARLVLTKEDVHMMKIKDLRDMAACTALCLLGAMMMLFCGVLM